MKLMYHRGERSVERVRCHSVLLTTGGSRAGPELRDLVGVGLAERDLVVDVAKFPHKNQIYTILWSATMNRICRCVCLIFFILEKPKQ